ncbi:MAG: ATP-binding cassette domain-containing protein [Ruminococcus sp.]|nr:ATP-binding cassette domain-containing protein [Ruminococcus sp.]
MDKTVISVKELTKQFMKQKAVDNVSFSIKEGMICGLIGPNGAGKTTIMKILGGLVLPTQGSIQLYGGFSEKELAHARSRMSFMIETPYAKAKMTAKENLTKQCLQKGVPDLKRIDEVLEIVGLGDTGKKKVGNFSLGMRQRLGIAGALLTKPEIMVLDEPVNGLDPEGIVEVRELLLRLNRDNHITILISSHILAELSQMCTDYMFINKGKMVSFRSAEELRKECSDYFCIHTDNDSLAAAVLSEKMGITTFDTADDGSIRLFDNFDDIRTVSKTLYENGVIPLTMYVHEANLEQYYMNMVGDQNAEHYKISDIHNEA